MDFMGVVRQVDSLGRLVIPREFRKLLDIEDGVDSLEISVNENKEIVLKKHNPACIICGEKERLVSLDEKLICTACLDKLNKTREENGF